MKLLKSYFFNNYYIVKSCKDGTAQIHRSFFLTLPQFLGFIIS